ncbi:helix-turn-helix domain-containing protein [Mycobacterium marinum]|uniref:helix-turn-helix domain-containing protein n=1 Tax=Mycobacterium marinum TaxID=1781 RepID=UPI0023585F60|nr:helix-turn-helix domain-containing protein [Mycobacterium marinum]MDC8982163.1 helix-turn-helix domain-containing protein [Mycobacterium marinum]MDC8998885.1 helix-turn-helix domain-containing protein [Mycobacterium marinum]MDC9009608.1 helix-turn-helix domain-containing protein [Mycobacterium marinum]
MERVDGVMISVADARYVLAALEALLTGRSPSAQLSQFIGQLRKTVVRASDSGSDTSVDVRKLGLQQDSGHHGLYDLVDSGEAAAIIGCTSANVRDLGKRGRIPRYLAGGRWVYPVASVIAWAERKAAKRS